MNRIRLWLRWCRRMQQYSNLMQEGKSHAECVDIIQAMDPLTLQEHVYEHAVRKRGGPPKPWNPPPSEADAQSFAAEIRELQRVAGLTEEQKSRELFDEINNSERQLHGKIREIIQHAAEKSQIA